MSHIGMIDRQYRRLTFALLLLMCASSTSAYEPNYVWRRSSDYSRGEVSGLSAGNPNRDSTGSEAWFYGWVTGTATTGNAPWLFNQATPMVWDEEWLGGRWARFYERPGTLNGNPPIGKGGMTHDFSFRQMADAYMPVVYWLNPSDNRVQIDILG